LLLTVGYSSRIGYNESKQFEAAPMADPITLTAAAIATLHSPM